MLFGSFCRTSWASFSALETTSALPLLAALDYTENLSASGLFIRTERDFALGERVTLVVSFPQLLEPVELQVEILRRRAASIDAPAGVAVRVPPDCVSDLGKLAEIARKVGAPRADGATVRVLLVEDNALVA